MVLLLIRNLLCEPTVGRTLLEDLDSASHGWLYKLRENVTDADDLSLQFLRTLIFRIPLVTYVSMLLYVCRITITFIK